jgi:hypothetical protein
LRQRRYYLLTAATAYTYILPQPIESIERQIINTDQKYHDVGTQVDENLLEMDILQNIYIGLRQDLKLTRLKASVKNKESVKEAIWRIYSKLVPRINEVEHSVDNHLKDTRLRCENELVAAIEEMRGHHLLYNEESIKHLKHELDTELQSTESSLRKERKKFKKIEEEYEMYVVKVAKLTKLLSKHSLIPVNELLAKEINIADEIVAKYTKEIGELSEQINKLRIKANMGKLGRESREQNPVSFGSDSSSPDRSVSLEKIPVPTTSHPIVPNPTDNAMKTISSNEEEIEIDQQYIESDPRIQQVQRAHLNQLNAVRTKRERLNNLWIHKINSILRIQNTKAVQKIVRRQERMLRYAENLHSQNQKG